MTQAGERTKDPAAGVTIHAARPEDLPACADVWHISISDYLRRLNQPQFPMNLDPLVGLLGHLLATDPEAFLVAKLGATGRSGEAGRIVAFASAVQREHVWFLALLFVEPSMQRRGLGSELLRRVFPRLQAPSQAHESGDERPGVLATCTDSVQPISNALYARYGIVPRMPIVNLAGRPRADDALPPLPRGIVPLSLAELEGREGSDRSPVAEIVDSIDRTLLGYGHRQDHEYRRRAGRVGYLYRGPDGEALGYGYTSRVGTVGPIALLDETLMAPVLGHLLTVLPPPGASSVWIPGANDRAIVALLRAGLRFDGFPCLLCETRPFADFARYVPGGLSLL